MGGMESKTTFKRNVFVLYEEADRVIPLDHEHEGFWTSFLALPTSAEDVHSLFMVREAKILVSQDSAPAVRYNLKTLLLVALNRIHALKNMSARPDPSLDVAQVQNAMRILTRIIPFIFSATASKTPSKSHVDVTQTPALSNLTLEEDLFWSLGDGDTDEGGEEQSKGVVLLQDLVTLFFFQGFTLAMDVDNAEPNIVEPDPFNFPSQNVPPTFIPATPPPTTRENLQCKTELLRLLLACLSKPLYSDPNSVTELHDKWRECFFTSIPKDKIQALVLNLLQSVMHYQPTSVWSMITPTFLSTFQEQENVAQLSLQLLLILLDRRGHAPASTSPQLLPAASSTSVLVSSPALVTWDSNVVSEVIEKLEDFSALEMEIKRLLEAGLPDKFQAEFITLLWELMLHNERFFQSLLQSSWFHTFFLTVVEMLFTSCRQPASIGIFRQTSFLLHFMSADRKFGERLGEPMSRKLFTAFASWTRMLAALPTFQGTWADFYSLLIHHIIVASSVKTHSKLFENLLISLANASPYIGGLHITASSKLVSLFASFTHPVFLLSSPIGHRLLFYVLEVFNNLLLHHASANLYLIYILVQKDRPILALQDLDWATAYTEYARVLESRQSSSDLTSPTASSPSESHPSPSFTPQQQWFEDWKRHMPLEVLLSLLDHIRPLVVQFFEAGEASGTISNEQQALAFLRTKSFVGLIPLPGTIYTRKFYFTRAVNTWFTCFIWSSVFASNSSVLSAVENRAISPPIWLGTDVRLFEVKRSPTS